MANISTYIHRHVFVLSITTESNFMGCDLYPNTLSPNHVITPMVHAQYYYAIVLIITSIRLRYQFLIIICIY